MSLELNAALVQYAELQQRATDIDTIELDAARQAIRPDKEYEVLQRLQNIYGKRFESKMLTQSRKDIADLLGTFRASFYPTKTPAVL